MASQPNDPRPSTSTQFPTEDGDEIATDDNQSNKDPICSGSGIDPDKELSKMLTVEEFLLKSKTYMLDFEKYMFLDTIDSDCLVVCAK